MFIDRLNPVTASRLAVVRLDASLQVAAMWLSKPQIGLVAVCDSLSTLKGVVSKSDLVKHFAVNTSPPPRVSSLMSQSVVSCRPGDDVHDVWKIMASRNLQNVPVVNDAGKPIGILDIRDAMKVLFAEEQFREQVLFDYVSGVGYR